MTNELKIFNSDVIPVYETDTGNKVVLGRELYEKLGLKARYNDWINNMTSYGFEKDVDYTSFTKNLVNGGRRVEHVLSLDMAKHIAMIQRTPQGTEKDRRDYRQECRAYSKSRIRRRNQRVQSDYSHWQPRYIVKAERL